MQTTSLRATCKKLAQLLREVAAQYRPCAGSSGQANSLLRYQAFLEELQRCEDADCSDLGGDSSGSGTEGVVFRPRDAVKLHSLQAAQHNGKIGTLVAFHADSSRWRVDLANGSSLKVKEANLTKLPTNSSPRHAAGF